MITHHPWWHTITEQPGRRYAAAVKRDMRAHVDLARLALYVAEWGAAPTPPAR